MSAPVQRRAILAVGATLAVVWLVLSELVVPALIGAAYEGRSFGFLNRMISGQGSHPVTYYTGMWAGLARTATVAILFGAVALFLLLRYRVRVAAFAASLPWGRLALVAVVGSLGLWGIASLSYPYGWDHGILASVGDAIARGGVPYRDAWDMKGPVAYLPFAFVQAVFDGALWGIRIVDLAILIVGGTIVARVVGRLGAPAAGRWAALAFAAWYASLGYFYTAQPEGWIAVACAAAAAAVLVPDGAPSGRALFASGVFVGVCVLLKPPFALFGLVPLAAAPRHTLRAFVRGGALAIAGAASVVAGCVLWFAIRGGLGELLAVHIVYPLRAYAGGGSNPVGSVIAFFVATPVALAVPFAVLGARDRWRAAPRTAWVLVAWLASTSLAVIVQGKFFAYHWLPVGPPLAVLAAIGVDRLARSDGDRGGAGRTVALGATVALFLALLATPLADVRRFASFAVGRMGSTDYYAAFGHPGDPFFASEEMEAAAWIRARTDPDAGVAVFGNNADIVVMARRPASTRFVFSMPLTREGPSRDAYRDEYLAAIERARPAYVVVGMAHAGSKEVALGGFPELAALLERDYTLERSIGYLDLYRRRGLSAPAPNTP